MVDNGFCLQCTNVHRDEVMHLKNWLKMHPRDLIVLIFIDSGFRWTDGWTDQSTQRPTNGQTVLSGGAERIQ